MRRARATSLIVIVVIALGWLTYTLTLGDRTPALGLDLQGGVSVVLAPKAQATSQQLDQAISIIRRRVDSLGVAEPEITRQGDFIVVSLPGIKDRERALSVVGQTAQLQFRPYCSGLNLGLPEEQYQQALDPATGGQCVQPKNGATTTTTTPSDSSTTATTAPGETTTTAAGDTSTTAPGETTTTATGDTGTTTPGQTTTTTAPGATTTTTGPESLPCGKTGEAASTTSPDLPIVAPDDSNKDGTFDQCAVLGPVFFGGDAVSSATAAIPQGKWVVDLTLKDSGLSKFNELAAHCFDKDQTCPGGSTAIVLDGVVENNPAPQQREFTSNQVEISGSPSESAARDLALVLNYGALPVQLEQQRVETVSATLGRDSLARGLIAGAIGVAVVLLYILLYYRALGLVVVMGLCIWSALLFSIIVWLSSSSGLALSLAGVTGIIVSIGVTVDSYVVYFERLKDEVHTGKTVRSSVDRAFKSAWRTIVTADLSSFMAAALLFWLTVGAVRGFAFFLGLSTLLDIVTAYFFTRPLVSLLGRSRFLTDARWVGVRAGLALDPEPRDPKPEVQAAPAGAGR